MKLIYKILIIVGLLLATYIGAFIHGRYSTESQPTKYVRQLRIELDSSVETNRKLQEINSELGATNNQLRKANTESARLLNDIRYSVEEFEKGFEGSGDIINECIKLVRELRKVYSETAEE